MSEIQLILIKSNKIVCIKEHYRVVRDIINNVSPIDSVHSQELDAGYILIDLDRKVMLNCQEAFAADEIKCLREFAYLVL